MPSNYTKYCRIVLLFLAIIPSRFCGQDEMAGKAYEGKMYFRHLTRESGLPSNEVRCIVKDYLGYLWIGTDNGLVKYDGQEMKAYRYVPGDTTSLVASSVSCLMQARDSMLWVGTKNGLSLINPFTAKIRNFKYNPTDSTSFPAAWILCFFEDADFVWIGTNTGIIRCKPDQMEFKRVKLHRNEVHNHRENLFRWVNQIALDPRDHNKLLLATRGGLLLFDKENLQVSRDYEKNVSHSFKCTSLYIDKDTVLWTGEWDTGLKRFDLTNESWQIINPKEQPLLNILDIQARNRNELWLGTVGKGIGMYNKNSGNFIFHAHDPSDPRSLTSNWVHGNLLSTDNKIFVPTNSGLSISDPLFKSFNKIKIPFEFGSVSGFYKDEMNNLLYITATQCKGLISHNMQTGAWQNIPVGGIPAGKSLSLYGIGAETGGRIWVGSNHGLLRMNERRDTLILFRDNQNKPVKGRDTVIMSIFNDSKNQLWIGTRFDGIFRIDPENGQPRQFIDDSSGGKDLRSYREFRTIREDRTGKIWFGSYNGLICRDRKNEKFFNPIHDYLEEKGLDDKVVWGIETDTMGRLYFSIDDEGLLRAEEKPDGHFDFKLYHLNHGLNDLNLFEMDRDPWGNIWIINEGITCFNPATESFRVIDTRNGLHKNKNWGNTIYIDEDGNIFLDADQGFETININDIQQDEQITNLLAEYIEVNSKLHPVKGKTKQKARLNLRPFENDIVFYYKAICFGDPDQVKYKYMLEGYDRDWQLAGTETRARYTSLSPGAYIFRVQAAHRGVWYDKTIEISLNIKPYFWQTWWFITLAVAFFILLISGVILLRTRQVRKQESIKSGFQKKMADLEMEALRAQMNPHFIFNSLNSINNFILKNETEQASDFLIKFSRLIRQVLNNSKNKYVSLSDEFRALELYIQLEQLRFEYRFNYKLLCREQLDKESVLVPPLIIQPYVENAIWHGLLHKEENGTISIEVDRTDDTLRFVVSDDGIGRLKAMAYKSKYGAEKKSVGMSITRNRIHILSSLYDLKAETHVEDLYDDEGKAAGTKVTVKIPLLNKNDISHESTYH